MYLQFANTRTKVLSIDACFISITSFCEPHYLSTTSPHSCQTASISRIRHFAFKQSLYSLRNLIILVFTSEACRRCIARALRMPAPSPPPRRSSERRGRSPSREGSVKTEPPSRYASRSRASPGAQPSASKRRASPGAPPPPPPPPPSAAEPAAGWPGVKGFSVFGLVLLGVGLLAGAFLGASWQASRSTPYPVCGDGPAPSFGPQNVTLQVMIRDAPV